MIIVYWCFPCSRKSLKTGITEHGIYGLFFGCTVIINNYTFITKVYYFRQPKMYTAPKFMFPGKRF